MRQIATNKPVRQAMKVGVGILDQAIRLGRPAPDPDIALVEERLASMRADASKQLEPA